MVIKNFLFHRVTDEKDQLWPPITVSLFDKIIAHISSRYQVINLEEFLNGRVEIRKDRKPVTILFDDGYKDNIEYAMPVLNKYKCPASLYVVSGCIDNNIPTWTYSLDYVFQHTQKLKIDFDFDFVFPEFRSAAFSNAAERLAFGARFKPWLKNLSQQKRNKVLDTLFKSFNDVAPPRDKMMSWDEIRQLKNEGYTIGSHSVTHPLLATIENDEELLAELKVSAQRIEEETGVFPETISYPIGSYDERVTNLAKKAGYKWGLAVKQQAFDDKRDDIYAIPRIEIYNEPMWKCRWRMNGFFEWLKKIRN